MSPLFPQFTFQMVIRRLLLISIVGLSACASIEPGIQPGEPTIYQYTRALESGLSDSHPYPNPDDVCVLLNSTSLIKPFELEDYFIIACPKHEMGAIKDHKEKQKAHVVGNAKHWIIMRVPITEKGRNTIDNNPTFLQTPKQRYTSGFASDPVGANLSLKKLKPFKESVSAETAKCCPNDFMDEHLRLGDSRAAIVMKTHPFLLVAVYSDELDAVAMLRFETRYVALYNLKKMSRLLTVNTYTKKDDVKVVADLELGSKELGLYKNFRPLIADFLSDDMGKILKRKNGIHAKEWLRTQFLAEQYIKKNGYQGRNGSPYLSNIPSNKGMEYHGEDFEAVRVDQAYIFKNLDWW